MEAVLNTIRVLLVDDHRTVLWGLERLIDSARPKMKVVGTASSAVEALEQFEQCTPDVVLLDLDLDGKSGLDLMPVFLHAAKARVLVLSGSRDQALRDAAVRAGARGIVGKEASADQLLKAIEKTAMGELWLDRETLGRVFSSLTVQNGHRPEHGIDAKSGLTTREHEIVDAITRGSGCSNRELAQQLYISEHTLRNHLTSIYQKLGVANRLELYVYAVKHRLG